MATDRLPNRWGIAVAAVIMQICLGAVYGWSVFVKPLIGVEHWTLTQVSLNFTLSIAFLGFGTVIGGLWQDRVGPRRVATVAGILYGAGYMVASYAPRTIRSSASISAMEHWPVSAWGWVISARLPRW